MGLKLTSDMFGNNDRAVGPMWIGDLFPGALPRARKTDGPLAHSNAFVALVLTLLLASVSQAQLQNSPRQNKSAPISPQQQQQETPPQDLAAQATEQLSKIKQQLEADTKLEQPAKEKLQATVAATELNVTSIATESAEIKKFEAAIENAEQRSTAAKAEFEKLSAAEPATVDSSVKGEALTQTIQDLKTETDTLKAALKANEEASISRITRNKESRKNTETLTDKITELTAQLETPPIDESLAAKANLLKLQSDLALAELQKTRLQTEQRRDEAEDKAGLLKNQHDLIELKLKRADTLLQGYEKTQRDRLKSKAEQLYAAAVEKENEVKRAAEANPNDEAVSPSALLLPSFQFNTQLAEKVKNTEKQVATAAANADSLKTAVESLKDKFRVTEVRVKEIGLTASVGALLRKRRADLIESANLAVLNEDAKTLIDELQYERFEVGEMLEDLSATQIQLEIEEAGGTQTKEMWETLAEPIEEIVTLREGQLTAYKNSLERLFPKLMDVQQFDASRRRTARKFREYINERILWIRSNNILFSQWKLDPSDPIAYSPAAWTEAGWQIAQSLGVVGIEKKPRNSALSVVDVAGGEGVAVADDGPVVYPTFTAGSYLRLPLTIIGALVCFLLIFTKSRMRREVDRLGEEASRGSCVSFWPTARAVFFTILIALALPLVPLLLGLAILYAPFQGGVLFYAIGRALIAASMFAIPAEVLRRISRPQGLGNQHFDWPDASVATLKKNLDWVVLPGSLVIFAVSLLHNLNVSHQVDLLERTIFVGGMLFAAYFLYRTYNAKSGVFSSYLRNNEKSWANQTSAIWIGMILLVPIALAILAFWGYYYTALNLAECAYATLVFALIAETIRGLARRFVLVRRRNAFIQTAKRKRQARIEAAKIKREEERKAAIAAAAEGGTPVPEVSVSPAESIEALTEIQPEEIEENTKQAYKLISMSLLLLWAVGIWMIWTDVLPALKALDDYTLWPNQVVENGFESPDVSASSTAESSEATSSEGNSASLPGMPAAASVSEPLNRVTVRDLLLFIVISIVTWIAATNLPNAFEILFLEELPFDRSFRYAIKALTSYAIVMLGVVLAFRALSIGWSNVQWLATALTFGLAFGLQEIFANFVAGIILMFERPMRIGDLITVDQFTGVVTKIRTRATTIVNWDRKEYVIPNKDFITGRLVNWTLSDAINRIEFTVGIAYGSDVELAKKTLYDILKKHPKVVDDPPSQVVFSEFGESSLNIVVKCFIGDVDSRPQVTDSLHTQINAAFNEAGIEISFPQRDLHLRTIDGAASDAIAGLAKTDK